MRLTLLPPFLWSISKVSYLCFPDVVQHACVLAHLLCQNHTYLHLHNNYSIKCFQLFWELSCHMFVFCLFFLPFNIFSSFHNVIFIGPMLKTIIGVLNKIKYVVYLLFYPLLIIYYILYLKYLYFLECFIFFVLMFILYIRCLWCIYSKTAYFNHWCIYHESK